MKTVNVDDVLKTLHKYGEFLFVTDHPKYREMQDEIVNLPKVGGNANDVLDKIRAEIDANREKLKVMADDDWYAGKIRGYDCAIEIIDKYKAESEDKE